MSPRVFVAVLFLILALLCDLRCASHQLSKSVSEQIAQNIEAAKIVDRYIPSGPERRLVSAALARSSALLTDADAARQAAEQRARIAEADAQRWRYLQWAVGIGVLCAIAYSLRRFFL
jgi:hypothetical protein